VAIEYFTKWIEVEAVTTIIAIRVKNIVWKQIVCRFGTPKRLISDNRTQFTGNILCEACIEWGIWQAFTSVEHPQTNEQVEAAKVILRAIGRRISLAKGDWANELPGILLSYHTMPQSSTRETPFGLVYGTDAVLPIEILQPTCRVQYFTAASSEEGLRANLDTLEEARERAKVNSEAIKRKVEARYRTKVKQRAFPEGDLILRRAHPLQLENKLSPKWTGPFRIKQTLGRGAYKLETLDGTTIPRTWNTTVLCFYFS